MSHISQIKVGNTQCPLTVPFLTVPSSIAAATQAKTASLINFTAADLVAGLMIKVQFTNGNTHAAPTLNILGGTQGTTATGAKNIVAGGAVAPGSFSTAKSIMNLTYDGTSWIIT